MKNKIFYSIAGILVVCALTYYFLNQDRSIEQKVLGSSINAFYSNKLMTLSSPPKKKDGASDPQVYSQSAVLIYEPNKYVLYSKNENASVPIASITKIMTAAVALDIYKLSDVVTVGEESTEVIGSKIFLKKGEKITVENLLYGLLMNSGNDAAMALSSGKVTKDEFVVLMNKKAREIGLSENTKFKDPAGLDDSGRSTARDIALLFAYDLKNETFKKIVNTAEYSIISVDGGETHDLKNSNRITTGEIPLEGVIGGKTGFTPDAGHTLVCAASRDDSTIIAVILKTNQDTTTASAEEARKLLTWGFDSYIFK